MRGAQRGKEDVLTLPIDGPEDPFEETLQPNGYDARGWRKRPFKLYERVTTRIG
ncbi:hypothetical protein E1B28_013496 [Marasmius oreades]|uniref:Uncharacterized protein n=1 Tax=Marasmius oreades TaxID=181124 RepID=A0A9P7RPN9_9AGAR|nr:uncharacterized protein E1B28_013496 [Marasmius oreades]KAG7087539.1 hypothetical protein E1B28_013496 [Marasmius oreades]